jgi:hypothetical protein
MKIDDRPEFFTELTSLINRHSIENGSNTPDYILAEYLLMCLEAYEISVNGRDTWYGITPRPGKTEEKNDPLYRSFHPSPNYPYRVRIGTWEYDPEEESIIKLIKDETEKWGGICCGFYGNTEGCEDWDTDCDFKTTEDARGFVAVLREYKAKKFGVVEADTHCPVVMSPIRII